MEKSDIEKKAVDYDDGKHLSDQGASGRVSTTTSTDDVGDNHHLDTPKADPALKSDSRSPFGHVGGWEAADEQLVKQPQPQQQQQLLWRTNPDASSSIDSGKELSDTPLTEQEQIALRFLDHEKLRTLPLDRKVTYLHENTKLSKSQIDHIIAHYSGQRTRDIIADKNDIRRVEGRQKNKSMATSNKGDNGNDIGNLKRSENNEYGRKNKATHHEAEFVPHYNSREFLAPQVPSVAPVNMPYYGYSYPHPYHMAAYAHPQTPYMQGPPPPLSMAFHHGQHFPYHTQGLLQNGHAPNYLDGSARYGYTSHQPGHLDDTMIRQPSALSNNREYSPSEPVSVRHGDDTNSRADWRIRQRQQYSPNIAGLPSVQGSTKRESTALVTLASIGLMGCSVGIAATAAWRWLNGGDFELLPPPSIQEVKHEKADFDELVAGGRADDATDRLVNKNDDGDCNVDTNYESDTCIRGAPPTATSNNDIMQVENESQHVILAEVPEQHDCVAGASHESERILKEIKSLRESVDDFRTTQEENHRRHEGRLLTNDSMALLSEKKAKNSSWIRNISVLHDQLQLIQELVNGLPVEEATGNAVDGINRCIESAVSAVLGIQTYAEETNDSHRLSKRQLSEANGVVPRVSPSVPLDTSDVNKNSESESVGTSHSTVSEFADVDQVRKVDNIASSTAARSVDLRLIVHETEVATNSSTRTMVIDALDVFINENSLSERTTQELKNGLRMLDMYIGNIINHPNAPRYRRIHLLNPSYTKNVAPLLGAKELLRKLGFEENSANMLVWENNSVRSSAHDCSKELHSEESEHISPSMDVLATASKVLQDYRNRIDNNSLRVTKLSGSDVGDDGCMSSAGEGEVPLMKDQEACHQTDRNDGGQLDDFQSHRRHVTPLQVLHIDPAISSPSPGFILSPPITYK